MIAIFDEDGGGDVDFQEFVSGLSAFSSKGNKEEKLRFAFKVYDIDRDGYISNGELFIVLKMMVGSNLKDQQLQQIVDKTIMEADLDHDGKISFEEFQKMVENTDVSMSMTLGMFSKPAVRLHVLTIIQINSRQLLIPALPGVREGFMAYAVDARRLMSIAERRDCYVPTHQVAHSASAGYQPPSPTFEWPAYGLHQAQQSYPPPPMCLRSDQRAATLLQWTR